jgi:23S rRNA (guanosine2251-2'-O)-methyltransferase
MSESQWIEGFVSVEAAVRAGNRTVEAIYVRDDKWDSNARQLQHLTQAAAIPLERVGAKTIEEIASGRTHGGIVARVGPRRFQSLATLLEGEANPCVVMIDGVEDPFNFGQAVRALYAAGVTGLVVRPRNWLSAANVVTRASAGATEWMATAVAETVEAAADFYHDAGLLIASAAQDRTAVSIYESDLTRPLFLVVGGEKRGVTRAFLSQAPLKLFIPYGRPFARSLGTATSVAVLAFELMRQRMFVSRGVV